MDSKVGEFFYSVFYPEKETDLRNKQGVTFKGNTKEFLDASKTISEFIENEAKKTQKNDICLFDRKFKVMNFKSEKEGLKSDIRVTTVKNISGIVNLKVGSSTVSQ